MAKLSRTRHFIPVIIIPSKVYNIMTWQCLAELPDWPVRTQQVSGSRIGESLIRKNSQRAKLTLASSYSGVSTAPQNAVIPVSVLLVD